MNNNSERRRLLASSGPGRLNNRAIWRRRFACFTILSSEMFERIAFYGIAGNLVLFLNEEPYLWTSYNSVNAQAFFFGISYLMSLVGGFMADSGCGKYRSIILAFIFYLGGYLFMPFMAPNPSNLKADWDWDVVKNVTRKKAPAFCRTETTGWYVIGNKSSSGDDDNHRYPWTEQCAWAAYLSLFIMACGVGIVKANLAPFGAEQVRRDGAEVMRTFFNWYYWCVNIGAFLSLTIIAYVQQNIDFFRGYLIPLVCLGVSFLLFVIGTPAYIRRPATGSVLTNIFKIIGEAFRNRRNRKVIDGQLPFHSEEHVDSADLSHSSKPTDCLDYAKVRFGGSYHESMVDDVKALGKIMMVFSALIPYWMVYFQMESTFLVQGLHMSLSIFEPKKEYDVPVASLSLFDVLFLLFLIPLLDRCVYPKLDRSGRQFSMISRITVGLLFSVLAVAMAGGIETIRLHDVHNNGIIIQEIGNTSYNASHLSILYQIPQYCLIGISEAFTRFYH
ncbi:solute carrier family 15 member 4-like [Lingula anatina]|uniref:Solute carrier family 15 member 4-like n=1 Tax=Lingula anatina TaxID=7574 RepID=A0A1S3H7Y7_LINAN|nr:solute carrier family 15 member 4-like [Lingula anatina]|eukprot:XP_013381601.1 solute carrier family 15 member 4-like [Lingula anatina]